MARRLHHHHALHHARDGALGPPSGTAPWAKLLEKPMERLVHLTARSPDSSSDSSSSGSSSSDSSGDSSKSSSSNDLSLPVALGVIIPIVIAAVIFIYLHRRHVRRLRAEDLNDPHKSLDFGWDAAAQSTMMQKNKSRKGKGQPEMTVTHLGSEKRLHDRGLSMDMDLGSPYVLPPGLNHSRESLHSMSRTIHSQDDRYRPATTYNPTDAASLHSQGTRYGRGDDTSSFAGSSMRRGPKDEMKQDLLANAQRVSRSLPPMDRVPDVPEIQVPEATKEVPRKALPPSSVTPPSAGLIPGAPASSDGRDSYVAGDEGGLRRSNTYLGKFIHRGNSTSDLLNQATPAQEQSQNAEQKADEPSTAKELPSVPEPAPRTIHRKSPPAAINTNDAQQQLSRPPRQQSLHASSHASTHPSVERGSADDSGIYGEHFKVDPPSPHDAPEQQHHQDRDITQQPSQEHLAPSAEHGLGLENAGLGYDIRRLSVGIRPLPPEDPTDNPEQRANRIRSFYKEYFDDSKPGPAQSSAGYYEDYDENYLGDGATYFDPVSGQFITTGPEYEEDPYGRRAMTPPPRVIGGRRHAATLSGASRLMPPGPRAFSSASGRFGPSGRAPPKKKLPPPSPLRVMPTPHLLSEDAFALPIDFAPPTSARDRQAGRPESPRGGLRAYSPMVPAHMPLASSYDDLAVMPSPHHLRKSGTFTALDFAPPPRIRTSDAGSDDGRSVRSNRSAMSARSQHALRAGAYRVSRIPKEVVGTKADFMTALKPQWNMHNNDSRVGMDPRVGGGIVL